MSFGRLLPLCALAAAGTLLSAGRALAGCQDEGAAGFVAVAGVEVIFGDGDDDGLPDQLRCPEGPPVALTAPARIEGACGGRFTLAIGTPGDDLPPVTDFSASAEPVVFFGGGGDDTAVGSPFGDFLHGGRGVDTLSGGDGDDRLCLAEGPGGVQRSDGGPGDDYLFGGLDEDELHGGPGADVLQGGGQADLLFGGEGDDALYGGFRGDRLEGGEGDDVLHGGEGDDTLLGGPGADRLLGGDAEADTLLDGGDGQDACWVDPKAADSAVLGCEDRTVVRPCPRRLLAAVGAELLVADPDDGAVAERAEVALGGRGVDAVVALAVAPDCRVFALVDAGGRSLVELDGAAATARGGAEGFVDLAFDAVGRLFALGPLGLQELSTSDAAPVGPLRPVGHEGVLRWVAFDSPEGFFFVVSEGHSEDPSGFHFDNLEPFTGLSNYVAPADTGAPVTWDSDRNRMLEVDADGRVWERRRRYAERIDLGMDLSFEGSPVAGVQAVAMPPFDGAAPGDDDDSADDDDAGDDDAGDDDAGDDDAGDDDAPPLDGGCGCGAAPGGPSALLLPALLGLLRRWDRVQPTALAAEGGGDRAMAGSSRP